MVGGIMMQICGDGETIMFYNNCKMDVGYIESETNVFR